MPALLPLTLSDLGSNVIEQPRPVHPVYISASQLQFSVPFPLLTQTPSHYPFVLSQPGVMLEVSTNSEPFQQTAQKCISARHLQILALMQNVLGMNKWI